MIVVDTSVWVDYFKGVSTQQSDLLDDFLGERSLAICDLVLAELLRGLATDGDAERALSLLKPLEFLEMSGCAAGP